MNELKVFNNENLGRVRVIDQNGEPYFVLKDVCEVLGLTNATMIAGRLDDDEVTKFNLGGLSGETNIVNESGLYNVILRSDKPQAKQFKKWITAEVLPSIRKTGAYMTADTIEKALTDPDFLIKLATELKDERALRYKMQDKIETDKPKVLFADAVSASHQTILVGELAKLLKQNGVEIGQNRLFVWLRNNGYLIKRKGTDFNKPTQKSMQLEVLTIKETVRMHSDGHTSTDFTPKVTGKGQQYFLNKFLEKQQIS